MKERFLKTVDLLSLQAGNFGAVLTAIAIVIMIPEVTARYIFGFSFISIQDLVWFLCGAMYAIGGAYTTMKNGHVNVDVVYSQLRMRSRAILDVVSFPFVLLFLVPLLWQGSLGFWDSAKTLEQTVAPWGGPVWLFKLSLPVGTFLIILAELAKFIRSIDSMKKEGSHVR
ncbi:MAG: 2,3-diketo-L-gulonate TRAP transporter small permease protein YiaM [Syntrophaceae bacterium PtaU1.Bin231]|nr:MAG: 2,3-diketo-L-gulonate TRAP transporter small permease protein YiaM [Syntrophaceae bacterium PtaU1.Bin231]HOG17275.1 TRAP transporter small permease subunit [Syntrophales bacterium]